MEQADLSPVFVDDTGRRHRRVARAGGLLALLIAAYLVLLGVSLARPPWAPRLSLPGIGTVLGPAGRHLPPSLGPGARVSPLPDLAPPAPASRAGVPGPAGATATTAGAGSGRSGGASAGATPTTAPAATTTTAPAATTSTAPGRRRGTTTTAPTTSTTSPGRKP